MSIDETSGSETMFRFSPFAGFARIARRHLEQMQTLAKSLPPEPEPTWDGDEPIRSEDNLVWNYETQEAREFIDEHAMISVIFACAAAELYINDATGRLLGDTYFDVHI